MMFSDEYRCIFLHNYKVAGKSMQNTLEAVLNKKDLGKTRIFNHEAQHRSAAMLRSTNPDEFDNYFVFGFIRNPWDRQVSLYHYILRAKEHPKHQEVSSLPSFHEFIKLQLYGHFDLLQPQIDLFSIEEEIRVQYIGRFEKVAKDFYKVVSDILGIGKLNLRWDNRSEHEDYRKYYTDETAEKLGKVFQKDVNFFSYTFDGDFADRPFQHFF